MTVTEGLLQIAELTKKNLQILEVLNDSFYTKSSHISTTVGDTTFTIPSYIALENKVNHLQDAFNNLVHAAKSGEAWFNFDGNSKEILVRGYQQAPNPIDLPTTNNFSTESKFMFKDMLTPQPYLDFDMSALPDDVTQVVVKKYIPYNEKLINNLMEHCPKVLDGSDATQNLTWAELITLAKSIQPDLEPENDYLEYDTVYDLPIRKNTKSGTYVIESILEDLITQNLENQITVRIRQETPLYCTNFDGIGSTKLHAGDILVSYDGSAKLKILDINESSRKLKLLVMSGEYVNPIASGDIDINSVSDYSKLRLYSVVDDSRKLHIPLEEDDYVFIAVAPMNSRLNIQTEWGTGLFVNTNNLKMNGQGFRDYYNANVTNMGDAIVELSNILFPSVTKFTDLQMNSMLGAPEVDNVYTQVVQINKHLNDSEAVKNIRALYSQKKQFQTDLQECQDKIAALTSELAQISFDDMSGTRSAYTAQIADLKDQQNNLVTSINKIIDNIATSANNAEIPIEAGKFRVRGYLDVDKIISGLTGTLGTSDVESIRKNVLGIEVRYRYKNPDIPQANVAVIKDFLFTEWATYRPPFRERTMSYENGKYTLKVHDVTNGQFDKTTNVPKFNQIDIPITQGEIVEFQVRLIWGFGYPFVTTASEWSELIEVSFPPELVKDVQVTTIIEENNSDIETNRFETILQTKGITRHIDDALEDQDITYFHKPESISSGFYTAERRVIPLKDKLQTLTNDLLNVQDILQGTTAEALKVQFIVDSVASILQPDINNVVVLPAWQSVKDLEDETPTGQVYKKNDVVYAIGNIMITNITSHTVNIFSMFPGARDKKIGGLENVIWSNGGVNDRLKFSNIEIVVPTWLPTNGDSYLQSANQIVTFRNKNPFDGSVLGHGIYKRPTGQTNAGNTVYVTDDSGTETKYLSKHTNGAAESNMSDGLCVWPMSSVQYGLCLETDAVSAKYQLAPSESYSIPVIMEYKLSDAKSDTNPHDKFVLGFNIRNSLYKDPLYYQVEIVAKYNQSINDALSSAKQNIDTLSAYNTTVR